MTEPDQNLKNLTILHACLKDKKPLSDDLNQWLLSGLDKLSTGQAKTIDESLLLEGKPGHGTVGNRLQKYTRDKLLAELIALDTSSRSKWAAAKKASQELARFSRRKANILRKKESEMTSRDKILLQIFEIDENTPTSVTFLYLLTKDPQCFL